MLLRIGKGVTVERVLDVLRWARDLGPTRTMPRSRATSSACRTWRWS